MKTVWIAGLAFVTSGAAFAQSTIYKHVDEGGRTTYSNKPMKGAVAMELDPILIVPALPAAALQKAAPISGKPEQKGEARPAVAIVTPVPGARPTLASIEPQLQRRRDDDRRRILEGELKLEEISLDAARDSLTQEQQNPTLIAAVRVAQQSTEPTATQISEMRASIDKASGRIRGLQATVTEHEKNIEALRKELGALKP